jgi:hypothetical protein
MLEPRHCNMVSPERNSCWNFRLLARSFQRSVVLAAVLFYPLLEVAQAQYYRDATGNAYLGSSNCRNASGGDCDWVSQGDKKTFKDSPKETSAATQSNSDQKVNQGSLDACTNAQKRAEDVCNAVGLQTQVKLALAGFAVGGAMGQQRANMGNSCSAAKKAFDMASLPAYATAGTCSAMALACKVTCSAGSMARQNTKMIAACTSLHVKKSAPAAAFGALLTTLGTVIKGRCNREIASAANCTGPDASTKPECNGTNGFIPAYTGSEFPTLTELQDQCAGEKWRSNPMVCRDQFCADAANSKTNFCVAALQDCNDPRAESDPTVGRMCRCQKNPQTPECGWMNATGGATGNTLAGTIGSTSAGTTGATGATNGLASGGLTVGGNAPAFDDGPDFEAADINRQNDPGKTEGKSSPDTLAAGGGGGGGLGGGGGGGAPMVGMDPGGRGGSGEDPQILGGLAAAPAAGASGPGIGSSEGSGGGLGGPMGRGGPKEGELDLKAFLPGEKNYHGRMPANVDPSLLAAGITGANGESNFEKITRKYQEKWKLGSLNP